MQLATQTAHTTQPHKSQNNKQTSHQDTNTFTATANPCKMVGYLD